MRIELSPEEGDQLLNDLVKAYRVMKEELVQLRGEVERLKKDEPKIQKEADREGSDG